MEHLGAQGRQLQHFVVGDGVELLGVGNNPGIGGVHAVHVGVNLAQIGLERHCQGNSGGVGAAAAQGGDVAVAVDALEAGHQHDAVFVELLADAAALHLADAGAGVVRAGLHAHLPAGEADDGVAHLLDAHGGQGDGDLLTGGEEHVHLALGSVGVDLHGLFDEVVGGVALGGEHHDHVVAGVIGAGDDVGDVLDLGRIGHRAASEFLNDQCHISIPPWIIGTQVSVPAAEGRLPRWRAG